MFKHRFPLFLFGAILALLSTTAFAEVSLSVKTPVELRSSVAVNSQAVGLLHCGAKVTVLEVLPKGWYKVRVDNGSEGYVSALNLVVNLRVSDCTGATPPLPPAGDLYYGSSTLFVLGASVKARAAPNPNAKVFNIFHTGDAVQITFDPGHGDDWAFISNVYGQGFVLRKFLGQQPQLSDLISRFDRIPASNLAARRAAAERAVELAWNTEGASVIPALERFLSVAHDLDNPQLVQDTELAMQLARGQNKHVTRESIDAIMRSSKTYLVLLGKKLPDREVKFASVSQLLGGPTKVKKRGLEQRECNATSEYYYQYPSADFDFHVEDKSISLVNLNLQFPGNAFVLNGFTINANTSEKEFLDRFSHLIASNGFEMHRYNIWFSGESYIFEFENGMPKKVSYDYDAC